LFFFERIQGEANSQIAGIASAFGALPTLRLGLFPELGTVTDEMLLVADRTSSLSAAFVPIRLELKSS
jgi:hypothetical protein